MRKKDRRSHKPVLRPPSHRAIVNNYVPFLQGFMVVVFGLIAFATSPYTTQAIKLFAATVQVSVEMAATTFILLLLKSSLLVFCLIHRLYPKFFHVRKTPNRYHRTHSFHMRLDRLSRYWVLLDRFSAFQQHYKRPSPHSPHSEPIPPPPQMPPSPAPSLDILLTALLDAAAEASDGDDSDDDGGDGDPSIPDLYEVSDDESEYDSEDDSDDNSLYLRHKIPQTSSTFLSLPPRLRAAPHFNGGGTGTRSASDNSEPIDVTLTSDDDDGPQTFDPAVWIHRGKVWSDAFPAVVKRARNAARSVPQEIRDSVIPNPKLTVNELLALETASPVVPSPGDYEARYTTQPESMATATPAAWRDSLISAIPFLAEVRTSFNDAWLSGATSIRFPHLPNLYPMWAENLLFDIKSYFHKRCRWSDAVKWLDNAARHTGNSAHGQLDRLIDACRDMLDVIPWDSTVPGLSRSVHLTSQDLAQFLSAEWLNDEMINAGVDYILRRLEPGSRVRILNCLFIQALGNARAQATTWAPATWSPIEKAIRAGDVDVVYFPLHVSGNHWTLLKIDIVAKTIQYADSLHGLAPRDEVALVQWWLKSLLSHSEDFVLIEPTFPYPRQYDSHSCGIIVLSTLAYLLLNYDLWSSERAQCERMEWFLRLSEAFADGDDNDDYEIVDSDYPDSRGNATTPEPSDYASSHAASSDYDSCRADSPVQDPADDPSDPPAAPGLEDVDLSFELPASMDIDPPFFPSDGPPQPAPHFSDSTSLRERDNSSDYYGISDGDESDSDHSVSRHPRRPRAAGPKAGSSWAMQKELKVTSKDPSFLPNMSRLGTFRAKVLADDPKAEFDDGDVRRVRCSHCTHWLEMRALYDLVRWKEHRATSKCQKARSTGLSTKSLFALGFTKLPKRSSPAPVAPIVHDLPCPGLTGESNEDIANYLARTAVTGGGAPSRQRIVDQLFPEEGLRLKDLDGDQQRMVLRRELSLQQWKLARSVGAVFSTNCLRDVSTIDGDEPKPCSECQSLRRLHGFQVAVRRRMPDESQMKEVFLMTALGKLYLKHQGLRQLVESDDGRSPWLKFAMGCTDGTYTSDTLAGMVKAFVIKEEQRKKGKSLKNMSYSPEFSHFCDLLSSTSPKAYETFQKQFGGPGLRSQRQKRAKLPKFEPDISPLNVQRARNDLDKLQYKGPIALSWDDTSLEASLAVFQKSKDVCVILGAAGGAIHVTEKDDLEALFAAAQLRKADKLRVYLLSIPLPKIPPMLVAAVARGSSVTAEDLSAMHSKLANLLHEYDIHPISMSSDGAEVERATQRTIAESAPSHRIYVILNSAPGCEIHLRIPLYFGHHPTIMTQDSKHALKTARNQIYTGARILVIGFFVILYAHLREIAMNIAGPLFTRDVEKVDKQDDRAAARVFSASTLEFLFKYHPDHVGLAVYLFVLGELVDAWQNRNIPHTDRAKMVLRARFFLMAWRSHVDSHPDYSLQTQFISRESFDIFITLCDSLLSLIVAYRQYYPTYPLLPWLHSTEVCEHLFGMVRQLKKDFTYSDILQLERKLRVLQMGAFANLSPEQQANQTASGYHHTYFKADDLDTATLMQWPSDEELGDASKYGLAEATQLLKLLGIDALSMLRDYKAPEPASARPADAPQSLPPQTFLELLALYESVPLKSSKDEEIFETCEMAIVADSVDKSRSIAALPDSTDESIEQLRVDIEAQLAVTTPVAAVPKPTTGVLALTTPDKKLDHVLLVAERMRHQTKSTAKAVRQHGRLSTVMVNRNNSVSKSEDGPSLRDKLIEKLASVVPEDTANKTTGVDRYVRHAGTYGGAGVPSSVRAQNKATVQKVAATKFVSHRANIFAPFQGLHENMYTANISELNPLKPRDFFIGLKPGKSGAVVLCEVITMYTKNTHHDWIPSTTSVGSPSYVSAFVYKPLSGNIFSSMACESLACSTVIHFPRTHILFSLASYDITRQAIPTVEGYPHSLATLCEQSHVLYNQLRRQEVELQLVVKDLTRLAKTKDGNNVPGAAAEGDIAFDEAAADDGL
ncbi:hypothetical protein B0H16DRAFT_1730764 [Mycena metata]|uniref:Ubiquitin-like protease family profile domain-containing protein n=1 Tax=Mycena metata TaxID=1033252 RepID=A0AAD7MX26_9AGAR|nr:hypothetical protein B0H16DRAFT_1730764 [Mycena metata]